MGFEGELKRGEASLIKLLPPPFIREGDKGGGLPNKNLKGEGLVNNVVTGERSGAIPITRGAFVSTPLR